MNNEENNELIDQNTVQETPLTDNIVNEQPSTISEPVMEEVNIQPNEPLTNENIKIDNTEKKPINKKKLFIIIGIIAAVIIVAIIIILLITKGGNGNKFKDPFNSIDISKYTEVNSTSAYKNIPMKENLQPGYVSIYSTTKTDYNNGIITADQFVMQNLYSIYEPSKVSSKYRRLVSTTNSLDEAINFAHNNMDKLSENTIAYILKNYFMVNLDNVKTDQLSLNNEPQTVQFLGRGGNTESADIQELDEVILSPKKHFLVYYTTKGKNASSKEYAEKVAEVCEETIKKYKETYGYDYSYKISEFYNDKFADIFHEVENRNKELLKKNHIEGERIFSSMPVYIIDYPGTIIGKYNDSTSGDLKILKDFYKYACEKGLDLCPEEMKKYGTDNVNAIINVLTTTYIAPNFTVDKDADEEGIKIIAMHELFHHYQHTVICKDDDCTDSKFARESTANLAVVQNLTTDKVTNNTLTEHSFSFTTGINNPIDEAWDGYAGFVFAYNYANIVSDGTNIMMNSLKYPDVLKTLDEKSNGKYKDVLVKTFTGVLTLDYKNRYLIPYYKSSIYFPDDDWTKGYKESNLDSYVLRKSSARYYYINDLENIDANTQVSIRDTDGNNGDKLMVILLGRKSSSEPFSVIYKQTLEKEFVINPNQFKENNDEIAIIAINLSSTNENAYYYQVELNGTKKVSLGTKEQKNNKQNGTGVSDYQLAKAKSIYCKKSEANAASLNQVSEVLVTYKSKSGNKINDAYVKTTLDISGIDKSSPAYAVAKKLLDVAYQGIEQLFNSRFKNSKTIYEKKDDVYSITVKLTKEYFDSLGDIYNFEGNRKIDILNGFTNEGYTCFLDV